MNTSVSSKNVKTRNKQVPLALLRRVVVLMFLLFLGVYLISLIYSAYDFFAESAESNALLRLDKDLSASARLVDQHYNNLQQVADRLERVTTKQETDEILSSYMGTPIFGNLRYYVDSVSYSYDGTMIESEITADIEELATNRKQGAVIYFDAVVRQECVAFFMPVKSSSYVDGVLSVVPIIDRETGEKLLNFGEVLDPKASALMLIGPGDRILLFATQEGFMALGNNAQSFLADFLADKESNAALIEALHKKARYSQPVQAVNGQRYSVSCAPIKELGDNAMLMLVYGEDTLVENEMVFIRHIIMTVGQW